MSEDVSQLLDKALNLNESGAVEEAYEIFRKVTTSIYASAVPLVMQMESQIRKLMGK